MLIIDGYSIGAQFIVTPLNYLEASDDTSVDPVLVNAVWHYIDEDPSSARFLGVYNIGDEFDVPFSTEIDRDITIRVIARFLDTGESTLQPDEYALAPSVTFTSARIQAVPKIYLARTTTWKRMCIGIDNWPRFARVRRVEFAYTEAALLAQINSSGGWGVRFEDVDQGWDGEVNGVQSNELEDFTYLDRDYVDGALTADFTQHKLFIRIAHSFESTERATDATYQDRVNSLRYTAWSNILEVDWATDAITNVGGSFVEGEPTIGLPDAYQTTLEAGADFKLFVRSPVLEAATAFTPGLLTAGPEPQYISGPKVIRGPVVLNAWNETPNNLDRPTLAGDGGALGFNRDPLQVYVGSGAFAVPSLRADAIGNAVLGLGNPLGTAVTGFAWVPKFQAAPSVAPSPDYAGYSPIGVYNGSIYVYNGSTWVVGSGAGGSGANTALSNLASVSINASLLPQTTLDLGSTTKPWRDLYLYGSGTFGTHYIRLTGTPTGTRTLTLPNVTDTVAVLGTAQNFTATQTFVGINFATYSTYGIDFTTIGSLGTSKAIRFANNHWSVGRNAANTLDVNLFQIDTSDNLSLNNGMLKISTAGATLANAGGLYGRNAANSANYTIATLTAGDIIRLDSDGRTISAGNGPTLITNSTGQLLTSALNVTPANTALSNLASVSINASLLPQTTLDLGSTTQPWRHLHLYGSGTYGTNYFRITGTPTGAGRTLTLPDATDTFAVLGLAQTFTAAIGFGSTISQTLTNTSTSSTQSFISQNLTLSPGSSSSAIYYLHNHSITFGTTAAQNGSVVLHRSDVTHSQNAYMEDYRIASHAFTKSSANSVTTVRGYDWSATINIGTTSDLFGSINSFTVGASGTAITTTGFSATLTNSGSATTFYAYKAVKSGTITSPYGYASSLGFLHGLGTLTPVYALDVWQTTAATNTVSVIANYDYQSSGTPTAGFGLSQRYSLKSSTTASQLAAQEDVRWQDATHASRSAVHSIKTTANGLGPFERQILGGFKTLVDNTQTDLFQINFGLTDHTSVGGFVLMHFRARQTTGFNIIQVWTKVVPFSAGHNAATNTGAAHWGPEASALGSAVSSLGGINFPTTNPTGWLRINGTSVMPQGSLNTATFQISVDSDIATLLDLTVQYNIYYTGQIDLTLL